VPLAMLPRDLPEVLAEFQAFLLARATAFRDERNATVDSWEEFTTAEATNWALALHCGQAACQDDIKADTAATLRCVPPRRTTKRERVCDARHPPLTADG
jgi:prolyl-tRNA synthetase